MSRDQNSILENLIWWMVAIGFTFYLTHESSNFDEIWCADAQLYSDHCHKTVNG